tara:strand:- start:10289 stop:11191 length:903 start_codon:yes stop_codon:yes gene_type:complete
MNDQPPVLPPKVNNKDEEGSILATITEWLKISLGKSEASTWQETLEEFIDEEDDVAQKISTEERSLLLNLLRFGQLTVEETMVPRSDIVALPLDSSLSDTVALLKEAGHSRMPVYRNTLDDVSGMIHVRDVLAYWGEEQTFRPREVMREILFVPSSMPIVNLLGKMRQTRLHMAIVVDEHGGTDGLVTIEDLVEEIVGEIEDEHDEDKPFIHHLPDGSYEVEARTPLSLLEEKVGITFTLSDDAEDIDTIGGLVTSLAGRVPKVGESLQFSDTLAFLVVDADLRRVKRVNIKIISSHENI